jgi:prophage tail gpP-like protein
MMTNNKSPFRIYVDGQEVLQYEQATLQRKKRDLTGMLSFSLFYSGTPTKVLLGNIRAGAEITVYIGNNLAFWGSVDSRRGGSKKHEDSKINRQGAHKAQSIGKGDQTSGDGVSIKAAAETYTITVRARGRAKRLVTRSHDHPTGTMIKPDTKDVAEALLKTCKVDLEWLAAAPKLDKVRFRDGASIKSEIHRLANENGHHVYETRDGKLRVTDGPVGIGEDMIAGQGILDFLVEQDEEGLNSHIIVKGGSTDSSKFGKSAVDLKSILQDFQVNDYLPISIQHFGDGNPAALTRRAKFEAEKRQADAKKVQIEVFHVQPRSGAAWDLGLVHLVELPSEDLCDLMECTELQYIVDKENKLSTVIHLSAVPGSALGGADGLASLSGPYAAKQAVAAQRRQALGIKIDPKSYPSPWTGGDLSEIDDAEYAEDGAASGSGDGLINIPDATPPMTLN